jgi:hypothetical protein
MANWLAGMPSASARALSVCAMASDSGRHSVCIRRASLRAGRLPAGVAAPAVYLPHSTPRASGLGHGAQAAMGGRELLDVGHAIEGVVEPAERNGKSLPKGVSPSAPCAGPGFPPHADGTCSGREESDRL